MRNQVYQVILIIQMKTEYNRIMSNSWGGQRANSGRRKKVYYLVTIQRPDLYPILVITGRLDLLKHKIIGLYAHMKLTEDEINIDRIEPIIFE